MAQPLEPILIRLVLGPPLLEVILTIESPLKLELPWLELFLEPLQISSPLSFELEAS